MARGFRSVFAGWMRDVAHTEPSTLSRIESGRVDSIRLERIDFEYPPESPLHGLEGGGILALPERIDPARPIVVAIHGHEEKEWARQPTPLFLERKWPLESAKAGYVVWAPVSMYHQAPIAEASRLHGFPITWAKIVSDGLDRMNREVFRDIGHRGLAVAGMSSGGQIGYVLMAYRPDMRAGIFAGTTLPLEFTRREYHVKAHPDCSDIPQVNAFTTIQALIAPRPVQFQDGRQDPAWPDGKPFPRLPWFGGTHRDVLSDEFAGQQLILRSVWRTLGGGDMEEHLHAGGHEFDAPAAIAFLRRLDGPETRKSRIRQSGSDANARGDRR